MDEDHDDTVTASDEAVNTSKDEIKDKSENGANTVKSGKSRFIILLILITSVLPFVGEIILDESLELDNNSWNFSTLCVFLI